MSTTICKHGLSIFEDMCDECKRERAIEGLEARVKELEDGTTFFHARERFVIELEDANGDFRKRIEELEAEAVDIRAERHRAIDMVAYDCKQLAAKDTQIAALIEVGKKMRDRSNDPVAAAAWDKAVEEATP